ncbi:MAG TPA: condensation domain-containing protein [Xanthobacteraceae bacterium]|nr:condensation domain-containing protein [Xanthobacteraceae bacterium]
MLDEPRLKPKVSVPFVSFNDLFAHHAGRRPDAAAILAPGRPPLSYGGLYRQIGEVGRSLRAMGIGREDRVGLMLPNGPDLVAAIICTASNAGCAVINPAYAADELERYFAALQLSAIVLPARAGLPARQVAQAGNLAVIDLAPCGPAGVFALGAAGAAQPSDDPPGPGGTALFMLTSGTTARPKIVPLTHSNVCSSAYCSVAAVALTEQDRCLNVLPLFHCHGLVATVLSSLAAGAGVVCAPGCEVDKFFGWLREFKVRWYSAVPTMHQAILAQARQQPEDLDGCSLRLVRSASAPLPPSVFADLERTFHTRVIEFYGMTETAGSPIACNPLPPRRPKAGSCGIPVGLEVAIMDDGGRMLAANTTGQVAIRGPSVMPGYDGDAAATDAAFSRGWFKTGDLGFFDGDGYLFLVGRSREMINRGGEKVTPREVDEALLEHPAVAEAVTFAVPHPTLGEDVAAAVVLRPGAEASAQDIRQFAAARLAAFKVPRQIVFPKALPKSATGKVNRIGLAAKLGVADAAPGESYTAPRTPLENALAGIWSAVLGRDRVGIYDDFFALGGDSLSAAQALTGIYDVMQLKVEVSGLFDAPTVAEMAEHLERLIQAGQARQPASAIASLSRTAPPPASPAQERLWTLQQALPDLPFFNIVEMLRITADVDPEILQRAFDAVVRRHEIFRTTFARRGRRLVQNIAADLVVPLGVADLSGLPRARRERTAHRIIADQFLKSFDLARGPLVRTQLVRFAARDHLLLVAMHQTLIDGWSSGVLAEELAVLYEAVAAGKPSPLPPLPRQFADFAAWQRQWRSHPEIAAQLDYWRAQLAPPLPQVTLAKARPRRAADDFDTAQVEFAIPPRLAEALRRFARSEGGTLFMALVAGLLTLMQRSLGVDDLRVATNLANRNQPGTEGLIGPLVNTVILRARLDGDPSAREVLRRVRATTLAAYANQDLPFEALSEALARRRIDPAGLARVMILLHNAALRPQPASAGRLTIEQADPGLPQPLVTTTTYDVILTLRETAQGLVGACIYKPRLFNAKSVERLLRDFRRVLEKMAARPERPVSAIRIAPRRKR